MRIFGSDRIKKFMNTLGMEEDEPIEHKMISNAIAKAQKKVEGHNFEIRKHLLDYDDVMNEQRRVIYRIRREILSDQANLDFVDDMIEDVSAFLVDANRPQRKVPLDSWPWDELNNSFKTTFSSDLKVTALECSQKYDGVIEQYFAAEAKELIKKNFSTYEPEQVKLAVREILLSIFDQFWKDHLLSMDHLKEGINLRAYAQKDPLNEYKSESFNLFENMRVEIKKAIIHNIFSVQLYTEAEVEELKRRQQDQLEAQLAAHKRAQDTSEAGPAPVKRSSNKVGRNDACPCGSGKKFKHCHGG